MQIISIGCGVRKREEADANISEYNKDAECLSSEKEHDRRYPAGFSYARRYIHCINNMPTSPFLLLVYCLYNSASGFFLRLLRMLLVRFSFHLLSRFVLRLRLPPFFFFHFYVYINVHFSYSHPSISTYYHPPIHLSIHPSAYYKNRT